MRVIVIIICSMKIHETQKEILSYLKENPNATIRQIKEGIGISSTSVVDYHITKLRLNGRLVKNVKWRVIED